MNDNLRHDLHAIDIDFNSPAGIRCACIQTERVETGRQFVSGLQAAWKVEVITLFSVTHGQGSLGGLFIGWNRSDWLVSAVARNHSRINARQVIIIVRL